MAASAALGYAAVCALVVLFQCALIAGAPWGPWTQGGAHSGALPTANRIGAAVSIGILGFMAASALSAAGFAPQWPGWSGWLALVVQGLSVLLNWITPSRRERLLWGPVTTLMLILLLLALFA